MYGLVSVCFSQHLVCDIFTDTQYSGFLIFAIRYQDVGPEYLPIFTRFCEERQHTFRKYIDLSGKNTFIPLSHCLTIFFRKNIEQRAIENLTLYVTSDIEKKWIGVKNSIIAVNSDNHELDILKQVSPTCFCYFNFIGQVGRLDHITGKGITHHKR